MTAAALKDLRPGTAKSAVRTAEKARAPRPALRKTGLFGPPRPRVKTKDIAQVRGFVRIEDD